MGVPEPTFCPECRMQRRVSFENQTNLYKRKDSLSGKEIFSAFSSDAPIKVCDQKIYWSDEYDALQYGRDYDFNKLFLEQFRELMTEIPWPSRSVQDSIHSEYSMNASFLKNCYFVFTSGYSEDCAYGINIDISKDSYDNAYLAKSELCYQGFMLFNCYKTFFSSYCTDCQDIYFCKDCINCQNCFACVNLRHKKYYIFNKPYLKEEYFKKLKEFKLNSFKNIQELNKKTKEFWLKYPVKFIHGRKNINVTGEYINNCKNVKDSYMIRYGENLRYCQFLKYKPGDKDCYDYSNWGENAALIYESMSDGNGINKLKFCLKCFSSCLDLEYCIFCHSSSNLFACVGLRHKKYCILNKQYTKDEYEELVPKIKKHMNALPYTDKKGRIYTYGEFFPIELSPFSYNETIANEYFPLTKEQAIEQGYSWHDKPKNEYKPTIKAKDLPDNIKDVNKDILKEIIECENHSSETKVRPFERDLQKGLYSKGLTLNKSATSKRSLLERSDLDNNKSCAGSGVFRIIPQELKFYQKMNLPLPHLCPDCRHRERIKQRNPLKLWKRQCMKKGCKNTFQTTYSPDRKEIVYCEDCYLKEVG